MTSETAKNKKLLLISVSTYFEMEISNPDIYHLIRETYIWIKCIFIIT